MRRYVFLVLVLGFLAYTAWTALTQVGSDQRGVVLRFGRVIETIGPGLHVGLPWGIDRIERVAVDRVRRVTVGLPINDEEDEEFARVIPAGQLLTGDHNIVNVQIVVEYSVEDNAVVQFSIYGDKADSFVARAAEAALAEWVAGRDVDDVLLRGKQMLPRWLPAKIQDRLDSDLGVRVQRASVSHLYPPAKVKDAFDSVNRAQAEIQTEESRARQEADASWNDALAKRFKLEEMTPGYVNGLKTMARVEAKAFTARLAMLAPVRGANPHYLAALWWDEMTRVYAAMRATDRLDLLDNRLARDGIDIIQRPLPPKK